MKIKILFFVPAMVLMMAACSQNFTCTCYYNNLEVQVITLENTTRSVAEKACNDESTDKIRCELK